MGVPSFVIISEVVGSGRVPQLAPDRVIAELCGRRRGWNRVDGGAKGGRGKQHAEVHHLSSHHQVLQRGW